MMDEQKLANILIRHDMASEDVDAGQADKIVRLLNDAYEYQQEKLLGRYAVAQAKGIDPGPATTKFVEDSMEAIAAVNREVYSKIGQRVEGQLITRAKYEGAFARDAVKASGGKIDGSAILPDAVYLKVLVNNAPLPIDQHTTTLLQPWLKDAESNHLDRLGRILRNGSIAGDGVAAMAKTLEEQGFAKSRKSAQALVLTANASIANQARLETFRAMKTIAFVEWSSVRDERTTQGCQALSGQIFPIDKPHPTPPRHIRCRSILLPRKDNTSPPLHKPYREWLASQAPDVQDRVLGKARGKLFRDGKVAADELYRKDGTYRTLKELQQSDAKLTGVVTSIAPPQAPKPFSPRNPSLTSASIPVVPLKEVKRRLSADVAEAANDPRYIPRAVIRGIKDTDFGKATVPTQLTDEAASMVLGLKSEVDAITDAFNIPRLRGIRSISATTNHVMNMGDGTLGINATYVNGYTGKVESKAAAQLASLTKRVDELATILKDGRAKYGENDGIGFFNEFAGEYREYRDLAQKQFKLKQKVRKTENVAQKVTTQWRVGDDPAEKPWTADAYFDDPVDRIRTLLYHETAHHVHDFYKSSGYVTRNADGRLARAIPRVVSELQARFLKFSATYGKEALATKSRHFPSKYAATNAVEWWAENFALYMMGRFDLVEPELKYLIEEMLKRARY